MVELTEALSRSLMMMMHTVTLTNWGKGLFTFTTSSAPPRPQRESVVYTVARPWPAVGGLLNTMEKKTEEEEKQREERKRKGHSEVTS